MNAQRATLSGNYAMVDHSVSGACDIACGLPLILVAAMGKQGKIRSCDEQDSGHFISCRRGPYLFVVAKQINVGRNVFGKGMEITVVY